jgi:hypothetical protein
MSLLVRVLRMMIESHASTGGFLHYYIIHICTIHAGIKTAPSKAEEIDSSYLYYLVL